MSPLKITPLRIYAARYPLRSIRSLASVAIFLFLLIAVVYSIQAIVRPRPPTPGELFGYGITDTGIIYNKFRPSSVDLEDIALMTGLSRPGEKARKQRGSVENLSKADLASLKQANVGLNPKASPKEAPKDASSSPGQKMMPDFPTIEIPEERDGPELKAEIKPPSNPMGLTTTIVVGRVDKDPGGVQWIHDYLKDITHKKIYIVDDPKAPLHLEENKGRESAVYLRYIIDNYDRLDDVTIFFHSGRTAWHNCVFFGGDGVTMINQLRREYVKEVGYFNMRCELYPGCPQWIKFDPDQDAHWAHPERGADLFTPKLWAQIFPNETVSPDYLAEPCCSQFAASREMIQSRPLAQWKKLYEWITTTGTMSGYSGRVMEYVWQYAFMREEVYCPSMKRCYCEGYGVCLEDERQLIEYNDLRSMVDDLLTMINQWNKYYGCKKKETKEEVKECEEANPYEEVLRQVRKKKNSYERDFPKVLNMPKPEKIARREMGV